MSMGGSYYKLGLLFHVMEFLGKTYKLAKRVFCNFENHAYDTVSITYLKVSKFQKQIFFFSFEPKNVQNYYLISALASKNGSNKTWRHFIILIRGYLT